MKVLAAIGRTLKKVLHKLTGRTEPVSSTKSRAHAYDGPLKFRAPSVAGRLFKFRVSTGSGVRGPAHTPANEGPSRQTCRAYLRAVYFALATKDGPFVSRRDRRRTARLLACLDYRQRHHGVPYADAA